MRKIWQYEPRTKLGNVFLDTEEEEVDDEAPVNILTGADWESVNYKVENVSKRDEESVRKKDKDKYKKRRRYIKKRKERERLDILTGTDRESVKIK